MLSLNYYYKKLFIIITIIIIIIIIMCLIFNFYIPFLTSVEEVDEEDEGRPEMPLERESFPEYEGKQRK